MTKFHLKAEFSLTKGSEKKQDSISKIEDFDTPEEAKNRLNALIVERMCNNITYKYQLNSMEILPME